MVGEQGQGPGGEGDGDGVERERPLNSSLDNAPRCPRAVCYVFSAQQLSLAPLSLRPRSSTPPFLSPINKATASNNIL